ncbi:hypothetical protein K435DRAFT_84967 [Dendrothele bispora CBS 962.96]|uniref:Uncharacterized protein n=1 Tax=Dendrothele bispora (strain CBS 962.96) TaxID=1314807 RepID=A0A4S8M4T8_DENBC|nr:hypothetical protein K435DRAFT_84967 [Dendrothele bispora CBS 962.96]
MTSDARRVSNARGATRIWATPTYGQKEDDYVVNNLATFRFGDPGAVDDDGHDPGPTHNPTQHRSHQSQQQQTILLSHHAELPSMSPIRSPISFNEFGEHSDDDDSYNDNISAYDYDSDGFDTESALRIEVGSAQFDDQSLIEGPALAGTWGPSSSSTSIRTVHTYSSSSQSRRRSRSWSSYSRTSSSSNDWRRLLGPVDMSTTTVATPPEFVSTYSPTDDETPYTHAVPQEPQIPPDPDAMSGYNLQFITQDFSSPLDFVSKSHQHQQDQARRRSSYRTSTLPLPIHPSPSTPPDSNRPLPVLPALQQLRRDSASERSARPLSIQSARTTGTFSLDDSFQRGLMTWGGEDYGTLRREWVIKKDKENNMYQNQNQRYPSQVWTGMFPGDDEVWANYWLGNFLVSREDVPSGEYLAVKFPSYIAYMPIRTHVMRASILFHFLCSAFRVRRLTLQLVPLPDQVNQDTLQNPAVLSIVHPVLAAETQKRTL